MKNIVTVTKDKQLRVKVLDIATFSQSGIKNVQSLIRNHSKSIAEFQTLKRDGQGVFKVSESLNEEQAYFLLTLMKNSPNVVKFKKELIKQFFKYRNEVCETNQKQLTLKDNTIKQLKKERNVYAKTRGFGFETVKRIITDSEANITPNLFNVLLHKENIINEETYTDTRYTSNGTTSMESNGAVVIHVETALRVLEKYDIQKAKTDKGLFNE